MRPRPCGAMLCCRAKRNGAHPLIPATTARTLAAFEFVSRLRSCSHELRHGMTRSMSRELKVYTCVAGGNLTSNCAHCAGERCNIQPLQQFTRERSRATAAASRAMECVAFARSLHLFPLFHGRACSEKRRNRKICTNTCAIPEAVKRVVAKPVTYIFHVSIYASARVVRIRLKSGENLASYSKDIGIFLLDLVSLRGCWRTR